MVGRPPSHFGDLWEIFFDCFGLVGLPGAFFVHFWALLVYFFAFLLQASFFYRFFCFLDGPGTAPDIKKPLKTWYCR